jgi:DNA-binding GntR family transcriptional regulator
MARNAKPRAERPGRLDRRNVGRDVAEHIRRLILDGTLKPNHKVPQDEVAAELGVSRIPVREALVSLAADGFVVLEPYRGAFVAPLEQADVRDQFELYGMVHGFAASRAVSEMTDETLAALEQIHETFSKATDVDELDALNWEFHRTINLIAGSSRLHTVLRTLTALSRNVPPLFVEVPDAKEAAIAAHANIIEALRERDPEQVAKLCYEHLRDEGEQVVSAMERNGFWDEEPAADSDGPAAAADGERPAAAVRAPRRSK